jgi:hypothetical protein
MNGRARGGGDGRKNKTQAEVKILVAPWTQLTIMGLIAGPITEQRNHDPRGKGCGRGSAIEKCIKMASDRAEKPTPVLRSARLVLMFLCTRHE